MTFNWPDFFSSLVNIVLIPAIIYVVKYLVDFFKTWVEDKLTTLQDSTAEKYLKEINDIIAQAVMCTTQTYVDALKAQGSFDSEAQKEAFRRTKETVLSLLAGEAMGFIEDLYGDANLWLETKIEQTVKEQKAV